jgi:hypothetical protein
VEIPVAPENEVQNHSLPGVDHPVGLGGAFMVVWAVVALTIILAALALWLVFSQPKETEAEPVTFVCEECGETHCDCYRKDEPT